MRIDTVVFAVIGCAAPPLKGAWRLSTHHAQVADQVIAEQSWLFAINTAGKGYWPAVAARWAFALRRQWHRLQCRAAVRADESLQHPFPQERGARWRWFTRHAGNGDGHGYQAAIDTRAW